MTRFVLDATPLGDLGTVVNSDWNSPPTGLLVVQQVKEEALRSKSPMNQRFLDRGWVDVVDILFGSDAMALLAKLRPGENSSTANLGEHASIALFATELGDATFVTSDKNAAMIALSELGPGRVSTPFDLWESLYDEACLEVEARDKLHSRTLKSLSGLLPGVPTRLPR